MEKESWQFLVEELNGATDDLARAYASHDKDPESEASQRRLDLTLARFNGVCDLLAKETIPPERRYGLRIQLEQMLIRHPGQHHRLDAINTVLQRLLSAA